ncbi:hypothetical protein RFI_08246 [Reticulomyxa filosa]|uniref:Uncharacterized protein n=1 Tax=Reticulomyxa filosa TaxID=46433 RepID=X6NUG1_RETFI|nr:hypothetical protein RFI_08246 [Reticulomyxa filosa]|eukprot:ETO28882.1 hypothetical protein RFI_08246 [Reticulomyxa filosa]
MSTEHDPGYVPEAPKEHNTDIIENSDNKNEITTEVVSNVSTQSKEEKTETTEANINTSGDNVAPRMTNVEARNSSVEVQSRLQELAKSVSIGDLQLAMACFESDPKSKLQKKMVSFDIGDVKENGIDDANGNNNKNEKDSMQDKETQENKNESTGIEMESKYNEAGLSLPPSSSEQPKIVDTVPSSQLFNKFNESDRTISTFDPTFEQYEYAAKYVTKPVFNNVFMEKRSQEVEISEVMHEIRRLFCTLHYLQEVYNIFETLPDYLYHQARSLGKAGQLSPSFAVKNELEKEIRKTPTMYPWNDPKRREAIIHTSHIQFLYRKFVQLGSRENVLKQTFFLYQIFWSLKIFLAFFSLIKKKLLQGWTNMAPKECTNGTKCAYLNLLKKSSVTLLSLLDLCVLSYTRCKAYVHASLFLYIRNMHVLQKKKNAAATRSKYSHTNASSSIERTQPID